jgi:diguanylate cyclase (GGDEF)-like protein
MTRLIGDIAQDHADVTFHLTSLNPIRPMNAPNPWEASALTSFEKNGRSEFFTYNKDTLTFDYMAPLVTQESCLACHARQGYEIGDIRGGIRISFEAKPFSIQPIITSHIMIGAVGLIAILIVTNQMSNAFEQLEKQTSIDGLTQINNRRYFDSYFIREFLRSRRNKSSLSILMADVDLFKPYNDLYGHQAGDEVLKQIAATMQDILRRPGDIVARYGGEEFAVVLPDTHHDGALVMAEMLRISVELLKIPHEDNPPLKLVTISIGFWTYNGEKMAFEEVLEKADKALYQAKIEGRNRVCTSNNTE